MNTTYTYKKHLYRCEKCGWSGYGEELEQGDLYRDGFEVNCPKCKELLELIVFPTFEEVLKFGSEAEKKDVREQMGFWKKWEESKLKSIEQLPDLEGDNLIFQVEERRHKSEDYLFIMQDGKEVWKEICPYEYYQRFTEIGTILKEKYGSRMKDLVPPENGCYLYGDSIHSVKIIENFRQSLE